MTDILCPFPGCKGRDRHHVLKVSVAHPAAVVRAKAEAQRLDDYLEENVLGGDSIGPGLARIFAALDGELVEEPAEDEDDLS